MLNGRTALVTGSTQGIGLVKGVALETATQGITGVALPVDGGWTAQ